MTIPDTNTAPGIPPLRATDQISADLDRVGKALDRVALALETLIKIIENERMERHA